MDLPLYLCERCWSAMLGPVYPLIVPNPREPPSVPNAERSPHAQIDRISCGLREFLWEHLSQSTNFARGLPWLIPESHLITHFDRVWVPEWVMSELFSWNWEHRIFVVLGLGLRYICCNQTYYTVLFDRVILQILYASCIDLFSPTALTAYRRSFIFTMSPFFISLEIWHVKLWSSQNVPLVWLTSCMLTAFKNPFTFQTRAPSLLPVSVSRDCR